MPTSTLPEPTHRGTHPTPGGLGSVLLLALCLTGCITTTQPGDALSSNERANDLVLRGEELLNEGLSDSALVAFAQALEENPRMTEAHVGIGMVYKQRGNLDLASRAFERAVETNPNSYDAQYNLGLVTHLLGQIREAIVIYLKALAIEPDQPEANRHLATAYLQLNEPAAALPYALRATELSPDEQPAWANLASTYALLNRYDDAIDAYRQAAELGEMAEPILLGLADAHIKKGNYARAINTLTSLIFREAENVSSTAHERLGVAQYRLRRYEKALESFETAIRIDGKDTAALNGIGACYMTLYIESERENTDFRDRALTAWRLSLQLRPGQRNIMDLVSRYGKI